METRLIFSGFGGQGVLLAGQLLAEAGMKKDKKVTWMPAYGPEMRGGAANCSVVISDEEIGTPIVSNPDLLVAMNLPSLKLFENRVEPGGYIIYNSSIIDDIPKRKDITIIPVPCNEIATEIKSVKAANMPVLGVIIELSKIIDKDTLEKVMYQKFGENKEDLIEKNMEAVSIGEEIVKKMENNHE